MTRQQQLISLTIAIATIIAGWSIDESLAGQSKICPHPQKFGHERGICNERLMYVVHFQVCPLYREGLHKYAKNPQNPSALAVDAANKYIIAKLQKNNAHHQKQNDQTKRTRRTVLGFEDIDTNIPVIDLLPSSRLPIPRRLGDVFGFVRTGGAANAWNNMINPSNWTPQNLVCECCYNVCTIQEMTEYCPKSGK